MLIEPVNAMMGAEGCNRGVETLFSKSQLPQLPAFNYFGHGGSRPRSNLQQSHLGEGEDVKLRKRECLPRLEPPQLEDDEEKWSLVDLLSRSTSATSQRHWNQQNSKSISIVMNRSERKSEVPLQEKSLPFIIDLSRRVPSSSEGRWARPTFCMTEANRLDESLEGTEDGYTEDNCEGSEYICGVSSASSISWAEDAVEAEQTINLAKLWNEVECACGGDQKPEKMSNKVYEECLIWRRAFPSECESQSYRFESMEEFQVEGDEDSTPTPTNDFSIINQESTYSSSMAGLPNSEDADSSTPTPPKSMTSDLVTAWLSECHLHDLSHENFERLHVPMSRGVDLELREELQSSKSMSAKPQSSYSVRVKKSSGRKSSLLTEQSLTAFTDTDVSDNTNSKTRAIHSIAIPEVQDEERGIGLIRREISDNKNIDQGINQKKINVPARERPSRLPIPIPKDDKFIGRTSSKPFLLWLFDRVSPT